MRTTSLPNLVHVYYLTIYCKHCTVINDVDITNLIYCSKFDMYFGSWCTCVVYPDKFKMYINVYCCLWCIHMRALRNACTSYIELVDNTAQNWKILEKKLKKNFQSLNYQWNSTVSQFFANFHCGSWDRYHHSKCCRLWYKCWSHCLPTVL